jgi:PAS domain S-box-containing protein
VREDAFGDQIAALEREIVRLRDEPELEEHASVLLQQVETAYEELRVAQEEVRTQHEEMERLLHVQRSQRWSFERVVALVPVAVVLTDGDGIVRMANAAASTLFGVRLDRLLGKPVFSFFDTGERAGIRRLLVKTLREGSSHLGTTATVVGRHGSVVQNVAATVNREVEARAEITWVFLSPAEPSSATGAPAIARALAELGRLPLDSTDQVALLSEVTEVCERALEMPVWVSLALGQPLNPDASATRSVVAQRVDGAQVTSGEGPCQTAWELGRVVAVADLAADPRWPRMQRHRTEDEVTAVVAAPIRVAEEGLAGVLNVYAASANLVAPDNVQAVTLLAEAVAAVIAEVRAKSELQLVAGQLREALTSRSAIDQAKGMIMALRRCDEQEAFEVLVHASNRANVKLRDLAADLVARAPLGITLGPEPRRGPRRPD